MVQTLARIRASAQPFSGHGGFLCRIRQQLILAHPSLLISLRRERSSRVIDQLEIAFVTRQAISGTAIQNVLKHLISFRPNDAYRAVPDLNRRPGMWRLPAKRK